MLEKALGSWPLAVALAVVICVLAFLLIFRSPLVQLISNVRRASYGKTSIEWSGDPKAAAEQQKEAESSAQEPRLPMVPANAALPPPSDVHAPIEREIRTALDNLPAEVKQAWLIRAFAVARVERIHEIVYRLIFGSQLDLVLAANTQTPPDKAGAAQIYERARAAFPDAYAAFNFDAWLHFPIAMGLLTLSPAGAGAESIRITPAGRDFLHYLVNNSLTGPKPF